MSGSVGVCWGAFFKFSSQNHQIEIYVVQIRKILILIYIKFKKILVEKCNVNVKFPILFLKIENKSDFQSFQGK